MHPTPSTNPSPELEHDAIALVKARLRSRYPEVTPEHVGAAVDDAYGHYDRSRVRTFVPVLVEHEANERLAGARGGARRPRQASTVALDGDQDGM